MAPPPPPPPPPLLLVLVLVLAAARAPGLPPGAAVAAAASAEAIACDFERECPWRWNASERGFTVASQLTGADGLPTADASARLDGHFLLLRGRRAVQREWALVSPAVGATPERDCRLVVAMHMANMNAGSVKAVVAANSTSWVAAERAGNDKRRWEQHTFNLGSISQEFLIILEIVTSGAAPSHVALDDIALLDCFPKLPSNGCDGALKFRCADNATCLERDQVCDVDRDCPGADDEEDGACEVDFPGTEPRCAFEKGWCGWSNTKQKAFAWALHRGASTSNITGPTYDHTYGNASGTYLYLNMSLASFFGEEAVLQSPVFYPPPPAVDNSSSPYYRSCKVRFYYHHFGRHSAALELRVVELGPRAPRETELWSAFGTRLNHWYRFVVELPPLAHRYFFRFEARRGMGGLGDQGLDDVSLSPECFGIGIPRDVLGNYVYGASYIRDSAMKEPHPDFINKTYYLLTPCAVSGRLGPQPSNCEATPNLTPEAAAAAATAAAAAATATAATATAAGAGPGGAGQRGGAVQGPVPGRAALDGARGRLLHAAGQGRERRRGRGRRAQGQGRGGAPRRGAAQGRAALRARGAGGQRRLHQVPEVRERGRGPAGAAQQQRPQRQRAAPAAGRRRRRRRHLRLQAERELDGRAAAAGGRGRRRAVRRLRGHGPAARARRVPARARARAGRRLARRAAARRRVRRRRRRLAAARRPGRPQGRGGPRAAVRGRGGHALQPRPGRRRRLRRRRQRLPRGRRRRRLRRGPRRRGAGQREQRARRGRGRAVVRGRRLPGRRAGRRARGPGRGAHRAGGGGLPLRLPLRRPRRVPQRHAVHLPRALEAGPRQRLLRQLR